MADVVITLIFLMKLLVTYAITPSLRPDSDFQVIIKYVSSTPATL